MKNRIPELRKKMGLSQAELADKLSVSRQTINSIEVERYTPSLELAMAMARLFKKKVEEVFTDEKEK